MNKNYTFLIGFFISISGLWANNGIIGSWDFQEMTSIFFSEPVEESIQKKNKENHEVLNFRENGTFSHRGISEGIDVAGIGTWSINNTTLKINTGGTQISCTFLISGSLLKITIDEIETDDFYASKTIITYRKKSKNN